MGKWDAEALAQADIKAAQLRSLEGRVIAAVRPSEPAPDIWRRAGRIIPPRHDIDHILDLQLGGTHTLDNLQPLLSTVNRSLGSQVAHRIKALPIGTFVKNWTIGN
jgi:hypothetical protein